MRFDIIRNIFICVGKTITYNLLHFLVSHGWVNFFGKQSDDSWNEGLKTIPEELFISQLCFSFKIASLSEPFTCSITSSVITVLPFSTPKFVIMRC